ncbi:P-loop containing nucleoside triphosphate hydrolase protein [Mycena epipterygia]|nr:P-loop containing nucleoside triphosphate hydrolase protein [Mycena epipterygia]
MLQLEPEHCLISFISSGMWQLEPEHCLISFISSGTLQLNPDNPELPEVYKTGGLSYESLPTSPLFVSIQYTTMGKLQLSCRSRTNALLYLAMNFPNIFKDIDAVNIDDPDNPTVVQVPSKFGLIFKDSPCWWEWTEAPSGMSASDFNQLNDWTAGLQADMKKNQKEGERKKWPGGTVSMHCALWAAPGHEWDKEVDSVLQQLELTAKEMWFKSSPDECGITGMPEVSVWQTHFGSICDQLFPEVSGLRTGTGNINMPVQTWLQCWLKESLQTARKARTRMIGARTATEAEITAILKKDFWREHTLDAASLDMKKLTILNTKLAKWTAQLSWTMKQSDEDLLKSNELAEEATEVDMAARWKRLSDDAKKMEWAGWAYGQVEAIVNSVRPTDKRREMDISTLPNETLKAAIRHGRRLGSMMSGLRRRTQIREATQQEIDDFDATLAENLRVWGAAEVDIAQHMLQSLWEPVDEDPAVEKWRVETFLAGNDLGVEEEQYLTSEQLCEMLGYAEAIPAAFRSHMPSDPNLSPPDIPDGQEYEGAQKTILHWHQKAGVTALLRKASQPPKKGRDRLPTNASNTDKAVACKAIKEGWANCPGVLLADAVGTGKTPQMLALVATLIQLFDYQKSTGKSKPRSEWPAALRFHSSFCGLDEGIPDAAHLFIIPASILPQFVTEAQRFFRPGAVDIFTIGTASKSWPADWARFNQSRQIPIRRLVFIGHPTLRNLMTKFKITYKNQVYLPFKDLTQQTAQPFNKNWLTIFVDEAHEARTGGKLYGAIQAAFETGLIRVVATATPMYQNLRDLFYMTLLLHSERVEQKSEQKLLEMLGDYTRLRNKTRKEDITHLTAQFETQRINEDSMAQSSAQRFGSLMTGVVKGFMADRIIRRTSQSKRNDGHPISEDLPPCTQVHVKVTLTPPELEAATEAMGEDDIKEAVKDTGRGNFFLAARKETAYHGASNISTRELQNSQFSDIDDLNSTLCTKLKCMLLLVQKILTQGAAQFFTEEEVGIDGLIKQDAEMDLSIDPKCFNFQEINEKDMNSVDKKILIHTEFAFLQNRIVSALQHIGISAIAISGSSGTAASRAKDLETFRTKPGMKVCCISNVGAVGLNIAFCSCLVIYDAGWSHIHAQQVAGRINRRGQKQRTYVFQMAADSTIDMLLLANGQNKGNLLKSFLSVSRNENVWKQLNNQADGEATWEYYKDEFGFTRPQLIDLHKLGKFKGFSLPNDPEKPTEKDTETARKAKNKGKAQKQVEEKQSEGSKGTKRRTVEEKEDQEGMKKRKAKRTKNAKDTNPQLDIDANRVPSPTDDDQSMDIDPPSANPILTRPATPQEPEDMDPDIRDIELKSMDVDPNSANPPLARPATPKEPEDMSHDIALENHEPENPELNLVQDLQTDNEGHGNMVSP